LGACPLIRVNIHIVGKKEQEDMARKTTEKQVDFWDTITLRVPHSFAPAAQEVAHRYSMPVTEYCRQALLLRLAADGVRLEDYEAA
jgi:hypothetical protein